MDQIFDLFNYNPRGNDEGGNFFITFLVALVVPLLSFALYDFFDRVWPDWVYAWLTRCFSKYEVLGVMLAPHVGGNTVWRAVAHNDPVLVALETYIHHICAVGKEYYREHPEVVQSMGRLRNRRQGAVLITDSDGSPLYIPPPAVLRMAQYSFSRKPGMGAAPDKSDKAAMSKASKRERFKKLLEDEFEIKTLPARKISVELEPGLFIVYNPGSEDFKELRRNKAKRDMQERLRKKRMREGRADPSEADDRQGEDELSKMKMELEEMRQFQFHNLVQHVLKNSLSSDSKERPGNNDGKGLFDKLYGDGEDESGSGSNTDSDEDEMIVAPLSKAERKAKKNDIIPKYALIECTTVHPNQQTEILQYYHEHHNLEGLMADTETKAGSKDAYKRDVKKRKDSRIPDALLLDPSTRADFFLMRALQWYLRQSKVKASEQQGTNRFFFYPNASEMEETLNKKQKKDDDDDDDDCSDNWTLEYYGVHLRTPLVMGRRYPLPSHHCKTFRSLFLRQKRALMRSLKDLQNTTGKFAVPGAPQCLTMLLHGPPGTGKTSLVKAMAHYLGRHIVSIPLGSIKTNRLLSLWLNDVTVQCVGERYDLNLKDYESDGSVSKTVDTVVPLSGSEVIYLLEDVDAVGASGESSDILNPMRTTDEEGANDEEDEEEDDEDDDDEDLSPEMLQIKKNIRTRKLMVETMKQFEKDKLTVRSLIQVIQSIGRPEKRVIVFTTNHPERLHPELLNPALVRLQINMGDMQAAEAVEMVSHYFPQATAAEREEVLRCVNALPSKTVNPSRLEHLCASCNSIEKLIKHMNRNEFEIEHAVF